MKRKLSLLLAVVMILGSFSFAFADEPMTEADAGEFLKEKGVLVGINGELKLEDNLRREDAVVMVARLHGAEEEAEAFPTEGLTFKDVTDPYYQSIISWAVANELFEGHTPEKFGYHEDISAQQYATVLLRALGYGEEVADKAGYDKALELADELGLLEGLKVANTTPITRGQMALMTYNALGTKMKDSNETLADKLEIEMPAPEVLEVEDVFADNLKEIKVVFNKDVDEEVLHPDFYETNAGEIENLFIEDGNVVVLALKGQMTAKKYALTIEGISEEVDGEYDVPAKDNAIPEVVSVEALGKKAIKVTMSEPVKEVKASNFKLDGKTLYAGAPNVVGREIVIRPYTELSFGEHELTVAGLKDYNNFVSLETKHPFEVVEDKEEPVVLGVEGTLERVVVTFSKDVDPLTVNNKTIYWMDGGAKKYPSNNVQLAGNKWAFTFSTTNALPVYETTIYISGVKDYSGNAMKATEERIKATIDETRPEVVSAELQSDLKTIVVKFSKPVNPRNEKYGALNRDHYRVLDEKDNKLLINKIEQDGTSGRVFNIVMSAPLSESKEYTLKIDGIQDNNKYPNTMVDYVGTISVGIASQPKVLNVAGTHNKVTGTTDVYRNDITILFSRAMNLATLVDANNYIVRIGDVTRPLAEVGGEIGILNNDGTLINIVVEGKDVKEITDIAVLGVEDIHGKKLENYGKMWPVGKIALALEDEGVKAVAKDEVKVTFNQPIAKAKAKNFKVNNDFVKSVTGLETKTLTLELAKPLAANVDDTVKLNIVADDEDLVTSVLGGTFKGDNIKIEDKIRPSFDKDEEVVIKNDNEYVIIELSFDENIKIDVPQAAERDIKVVRVEDGKAMKVELDNHTNTKILTIKFKSDKDSAYEISVRDGSEWITDDKDNAVNGFDYRTEKLTVLRAPKDGEKEFTIKNFDASDEVKFLAFGLMDGKAQKIATLAEVKAFIENEYKVTFNDKAIKIEDGKISITGSILSTADWHKVKENGDKTIPYRITVLKNDKNNKVAKIAMYEDGVAVIEEIESTTP